MARSRSVTAYRRGRTRYLIYAIPLIALIGVTIVYALIVLPIPSTPAAEDFTFKMVIQEQNKNSSYVRAIIPDNTIGEVGGYWASSQYSKYGVDSTHYPIYMDSPLTACTPVCLIHVKSTVVHTYTLGDFFNVWGQPLGEDNTFRIARNGNFAWELCVGPPGGTVSSNAWGSLALQPQMEITLFYYNTTGLGCALS